MNNKIFTLAKILIAQLFTLLFLGLSVALLCSLVASLIDGISNGTEITQLLLSSINTGIIALAIFELALVVRKEYTTDEGNKKDHAIDELRRTVPRFIGTVCIALSLEGLIMIIKYSQMDLAGNLYYPVAIISSGAFLLIALGLFIHFTKEHEK